MLVSQRLRELEDLLTESNLKNDTYTAENQNLRTIINHLKQENHVLMTRLDPHPHPVPGPSTAPPRPGVAAVAAPGAIDPSNLAQPRGTSSLGRKGASGGADFSALVRSVDQHMSASSSSRSSSVLPMPSTQTDSDTRSATVDTNDSVVHASTAGDSYFPASYDMSGSQTPTMFSVTAGAAAAPVLATPGAIEMRGFLTDETSMTGLDFLTSWDAGGMSLAYDFGRPNGGEDGREGGRVKQGL